MRRRRVYLDKDEVAYWKCRHEWLHKGHPAPADIGDGPNSWPTDKHAPENLDGMGDSCGRALRRLKRLKSQMAALMASASASSIWPSA
jgi:hypothetical protein